MEVDASQAASSAPLGLPLPVELQVRLTRDGSPIAGNVWLSPIHGLPGVSTRLAVAVSDRTEQPTTVTVPDRARYLVRAVPLSAGVTETCPPIEQEIEVDGPGEVVFDYGQSFETQTYTVIGAPEDVPLIAYATLTDSGRRISNRAAVVDGTFSLSFKPGDYDYQLELRHRSDLLESTESEDEAEALAAPAGDTEICGQLYTREELTPYYTVDPNQLSPAEDGSWLIPLPNHLEAIEYSGSVVLCDEAASDAETIGELSMALTSVALTDTTGTTSAGVTAHYDQAGSVVYNGSGDDTHLDFCIAALPGSYEVVVNAPSTQGACSQGEDEVRCGCGIFAEKRLIQAPPNVNYSRGASLELPTMASISGTLLTVDGSPIANANVEAMALGVSEGVALESGDLSLTQYNRSRQAMSATDGTFRLPLDVGAYDVLIKPVQGSGFGWLVVRDVYIANRSEEFVKSFSMDTPNAVAGQLLYEGGNELENSSLASAQIRAYTVVQGTPDPSSRRSLVLGQVTADTSGNFMLLMPTAAQEGWY